MQMDKKTKIIVLSAISVVIIALVVVLAIVLGGKKGGENTSSDGGASMGYVSEGSVVSIDEAEYNNKVAVMTPTDAVSILGEWMLTGIKAADGSAADAKTVLGRDILTTDIMKFLDDGSFMDYLGGFDGKQFPDLTGKYTINESGITLTYDSGKTSTATFDSAKQILTINNGTYIYTLLRVF